MLRRITIVQCHAGQQLDIDDNLFIFRRRPDFVVLPEYYNVNPYVRDTALGASESRDYLRYCRELSDRFRTILIAGSSIESDGSGFYNTSHVYNRGETIGFYRKRRPTENEQRFGILPGDSPACWTINDVKISVMICADVLEEKMFHDVAALHPDIIFIPTTSPLKPDESVRDKFRRDEDIFVAGARITGAYLVKCCAVGMLWSGRLQGRSLVAAPWGILSRVSPEEENRKRIISLVLDIAELREFKRKQRQLETTRQ